MEYFTFYYGLSSEYITLHIKHSSIEAIYRQQLLVGAMFADPAMIEHENLIHPFHRDKTMGNHQRCASLHEQIEGIQHSTLGKWIEIGGRFIQDEQWSVLEQGTGN